MEKSTLTKKKTSISVSQEKELLMFPKCKAAKRKKKRQKRRERNGKSERIGESSGKAKEREKENDKIQEWVRSSKDSTDYGRM